MDTIITPKHTHTTHSHPHPSTDIQTYLIPPSPIFTTHINDLHHSIHDTHHITILNDTHLRIHQPPNQYTVFNECLQPQLSKFIPPTQTHSITAAACNTCHSTIHIIPIHSQKIKTQPNRNFYCRLDLSFLVGILYFNVSGSNIVLLELLLPFMRCI